MRGGGTRVPAGSNRRTSAFRNRRERYTQEFPRRRPADDIYPDEWDDDDTEPAR